jgi:ATP-dependent Clp protease ATP-binding subunit ClpA
MLERFTDDARAVVTGAQDQARRLRSPQIGVEHLLLAVLQRDDSTAGLMTRHGVTASAIRRALDDSVARRGLDAQALATLGIDLDAVRRAAEARFGPGALDGRLGPVPSGHIRFGKPAKKVLEVAVREAMARGSRSIQGTHLLLGILGQPDGARLLRSAGADPEVLRAEVRRAASDPAA